MSFFIRKGGGGGAKNSLAGKKRKAAPGQSKAKKGKRRQVNIFTFIFSVADLDPGSGAFLTPGSRRSKKSGSGSGMNNPDHIFESLEQFF